VLCVLSFIIYTLIAISIIAPSFAIIIPLRILFVTFITSQDFIESKEVSKDYRGKDFFFDEEIFPLRVR
jgi:hypothetical protein